MATATKRELARNALENLKGLRSLPESNTWSSEAGGLLAAAESNLVATGDEGKNNSWLGWALDHVRAARGHLPCASVAIREEVDEAFEAVRRWLY